MNGSRFAHRDEADPQDCDGRDEGPEAPKVEGARLKVLGVQQAHRNRDGVCSRSGNSGLNALELTALISPERTRDSPWVLQWYAHN